MKSKNREPLNVNVSLTEQITMSVGIVNKSMKQRNRVLEISNQNEVYYLQPQTILYVEADGNYCDIHLTDGDVLETVSFQRAEIARKIEMQLTIDLVQMFSLVGKSYLVNIDHIMYINVHKQQLAFDTNHPGTCKKKSIKATANALKNLRQALDKPQVSIPKKQSGRMIKEGFTNYITSSASCHKNYDIEEDEVMMLGR